MKKCPYCAELIQDEAIVCRYCGLDFGPISNYRPLNRGTGEIASLKEMTNRLDAPLDKSPEGILRATIYYGEAVKRVNILMNPIMASLDPLLSKGRPLLFGKEEWDKEVTAYLLAIKMQSTAIFGEDITNSIFEVPDGCGRIWFHFSNSYQEALEMADKIISEISGIDKKGIKKAQKNRANIDEYLQKLRRELKSLEKDLINLLPNS